MDAEKFVEQIKNIGIDTLIGVPDSTLKPFCDYINSSGCTTIEHYVPVNEGAAVGLATGMYLATGKPACVYMQNSGIGNAVNPLTSIANRKVYEIPMLFLIGWRGEPGIKDEPQHKFMGEITLPILEVLDVSYEVIDNDTTTEEMERYLQKAGECMQEKKQFAFVIRKGTFEAKSYGKYQNPYTLKRETAIAEIIKSIKEDDIIVSTTGKISREVYEQSDRLLGSHKQSFLTVGGMGHASMIALGLALKEKQRKVYCLDGDGAILMHMGNLPFIAQYHPQNFCHIVFNNQAHESVGGMPTGVLNASYAKLAKQSGYSYVYRIETLEELCHILPEVKDRQGPVLIEIMVSMQSREDLGRPKETAVENKMAFMQFIRR